MYPSDPNISACAPERAIGDWAFMISGFMISGFRMSDVVFLVSVSLGEVVYGESGVPLGAEHGSVLAGEGDRAGGGVGVVEVRECDHGTLGVSGSGFEISDFGLMVPEFGFRISGSGFKV